MSTTLTTTESETAVPSERKHLAPPAPSAVVKAVQPAADAQSSDSLADMVAYAENEVLPELQWMTRLTLESPRRDTKCLGETTNFFKRALDICVASTLLILTSPLLILTVILVKLTSRGPIIFKQRRVGLNLRREENDRRQLTENMPEGTIERRGTGIDRRTKPKYGKEFTIYKFRTMRIDAEKNGAQFAVKGDSRVTPIGGFMRKTRIDELPQLWNVLRGEMSMVGPRPERPEFIKELSDDIPHYLNRLGLKPGLTGIAQVVNGYDNELEGFRRKVAFDLMYLQNCCLKNDLKILFRTVWVVLTGKGAL
jgi:lipopolysaccharide/colanic/teichoic acid biosynthesis glycosyltransferase